MFALHPATEDKTRLHAAAPACQVTFTGTGAEYFRIWIVNLLLTVLSLGVYSAWAKVRRMQYFARNTQLAGSPFDFRGDPRIVLRGRLLALMLLIAYRCAFGMSALDGGKRRAAPVYFNTHPATPDRVARLRAADGH